MQNMYNKQVMYGTMLGDAWIYLYKAKNTYTVAYSQIDREYALWKARELEAPFASYNVRRKDSRTGKYYYNTTVVIKIPIQERIQLHEVFYKPKKQVSEEILDTLGEKGLAIWFMDDGNTYYNG